MLADRCRFDKSRSPQIRVANQGRDASGQIDQGDDGHGGQLNFAAFQFDGGLECSVLSEEPSVAADGTFRRASAATREGENGSLLRAVRGLCFDEFDEIHFEDLRSHSFRNVDAHRDRLFGAQDSGGHECTVLGKNTRLVGTSTSTFV